MYKSIYNPETLRLARETQGLNKEACDLANAFFEKHPEYNPRELADLLGNVAFQTSCRAILIARRSKFPF